MPTRIRGGRGNLPNHLRLLRRRAWAVHQLFDNSIERRYQHRDEHQHEPAPVAVPPRKEDKEHAHSIRLRRIPRPRNRFPEPRDVRQKMHLRPLEERIIAPIRRSTPDEQGESEKCDEEDEEKPPSPAE